MSVYPVFKLLALSRAARAVQDDPSPAHIAHFEALLAAISTAAPPSEGAAEQSITPLGAVLRSTPSGDARLGAGDSRVFNLNPLLVSLYRTDALDSLTIQGSIAGNGWRNALAMLYQETILIDSDLIDEEGEFTLTALDVGAIEVHLRAVSGEMIRLTGVELA